MTYDSMSAHKIMLEDRVRTESYEKAILEVVKPGHRVLDFGCGTGILSFFAARAGAKKVYAVDRSDVIKAAQAIARDNNFKNIQFCQCNAADLTIDEPVDVIVSEWMGYFLFNEWMLGSLVQLRDRYLRKGGVMIPERISMRAGLVTDESLYRDLSYFREKPYGIDFSFIGDWLFHQTTLMVFSPKQLLPGVAEMGELDHYACTGEPECIEGSLIPGRNARVYGLCGWFDTHLTGSVRFDTGPAAEPTHWKQVFFPLREPFEVQEGKEVSIAIRPSRTKGGEGTMWRWSLSDGDRTLDMDNFIHNAWLKLDLPRKKQSGP